MKDGLICHFQNKAIWGTASQIRMGGRQSNFGPVEVEVPITHLLSDLVPALVSPSM